MGVELTEPMSEIINNTFQSSRPDFNAVAARKHENSIT